MIKREREDTKMTRIQKLQINDTTFYTKNTLDWINRVDSTEERISELEDTAIINKNYPK